MIGGYKIIDLDGYSLPLGGAPVTIPGIFEQISESKKATLIENLAITNEGAVISFSPSFAEFISTEEGTLTATVHGGLAVMTILSTDAVTIKSVSE